jgi:hypothetical protein
MAGNGMAYDIEWSLEHFAIIPQISWKYRHLLASRPYQLKDQT